MGRLLIADIKSHTVRGTVTGHGFAVAENYLRVFRKAADVKIVGGPAYKKKFGEDAIALPYDTDSARPGWLNKLRVLLNMRKLFRIGREDTIVLQSSAVVTSFIGIALWKHPRTKLFLILYDKAALNSPVKRFLFRCAKRNINGVICPYQNIGVAHELPSCVVPDYLYTGVLHSGALIPYADRKYDFCMLGIIWRSKGTLVAAKRLAGTPHQVLIAGITSGEEGLEEELRQVCEGAENIELRLRYLEKDEYDAYIRNSRYAILYYDESYSHKSSGVVFDFLFRGVPVIGSKCRTLQFLEEKNIGRTYANLQEWEPRDVLQENVHSEMLQSLQNYYAEHERAAQRLRAFLLEH